MKLETYKSRIFIIFVYQIEQNKKYEYMKSFGQKPWMLPQPVLIIGTYNNDGTPNAMNAAWGGQWDAKEIIISMGSHVTTQNLNRSGDFTVAFATKDTMVASDFVESLVPRMIHKRCRRLVGQRSKQSMLMLLYLPISL